MSSIFNAIKKIINFTTTCSSISYNIIKYKLRLTTFNEAVITTCNSLTDKNYLFTKVIQWGIQEVHNQYNIKDNPELQHYFKNFSSNVPYTVCELQYSTSILNNAAEYAKSRNEELLIENDFKPINSGTVALVFKGKLNNDPIVIKILRNNIQERIHKDIYEIMHFIDNVFITKIFRFYNIKLNFKTFFVNNYDLLLKQCDFNQEADNCLLFEKNLKNKNNVVIPHVYKHYTEFSNKIIVMDYICGQVAKDVPIEEFKRCAITFQTFFFESLFMYNILHGDLHLGNIILIHDNDNDDNNVKNVKNVKNVGIIDFGIVYKLTQRVSNDLFNIIFAAIDSNKIDTLLKLMIRMVCPVRGEHEAILNVLKDDKDILVLQKNDFSANTILACLKKVTSLENISLDSNICSLIFCLMSGLQTVEYVNDNKSLQFLTKAYINRSIKL
jgi:predicted unusual protein kinase regulating ubiquinone biosynthesis (AarF/ABC1/UbiB family)